MEMEELIAAGMSPDDAPAAARRGFGKVPPLHGLTREATGGGAGTRAPPGD